MGRRPLANLIAVTVTLVLTLAGIWNKDIVSTIGFGLLFIGLNS